MAVKTAGSALPSDFFTPHPRRAKGKERAAPGRDCPDVTAFSCATPPPCTGAKRASSIRSNVSRLRARRLSTRKTMHAPTREPLPPIEPFARSLLMAQCRHASSLPEPAAASGSSTPAWQVHRWHQSIRDYSSGRTSDLEEAWRAFEGLCRADGCESLEVHDMLDFASRIVAAATDRHLDTVLPETLRELGGMVLGITRSLSPRLADGSLLPDRLRNRCLMVSAAAMEGTIDAATEGLDELLVTPADDINVRPRQHVAEVLTVYVTALYIHQSAQSVLEFLLRSWPSLAPYLSRAQNIHVPEEAWAQVQKLRRRLADILVRVEQPTLILAELEKALTPFQQQRFGEYLIGVFRRMGEALIAFDVLEAVRTVRVPLSPSTLLDVVKALVRDDLFGQANDLFASSSKYITKDKDFDAYQEAGLYLFAHQGDVPRAQQYYGRLVQRQAVNASHTALMLHAHAVNGDTRRVAELFYHFFPPIASSQQVQPPSIYHYTAVILAYAKKGDLLGMNTWLASMGKAGIPPDAHVYNIILKSFAQRGDLSLIADLMDRMRTQGILPSRHSYTTILAVFAERHDVLAAEDIYKKALKDGIIPDRKMISALMDVYVQSGEWRGVVRTFDYLKASIRRGVRLSIEVYNTLLKAYVLIGAPFRVVANLFQKIEETGLRPDAHSFSLLIQSACDSGLMHIAKDLLEELDKLATEGTTHVRLNVYVLTIMMGGWLRIGERARARRAYNRMRMLGIQPSAITYAAIVKEYATDKSNAGLQIAQEFVRNLASPEATEQTWMETSSSREDALNTLFAPLLSAYARRRRPDAVEGLVAQIEEAGGAHTLGTLTQLLDVYRRTDNGEAVRKLWPRIYEKAVQHSQANALLTDLDREDTHDVRGLGLTLCIPLSIYVDAMSSAGFHDDVARTWLQLQKARLSFDSHNWNHLAVALVRAGQPERAFQVVEKVIIPARRRLVSQVTAQRDRNPDSPVVERSADASSLSVEEEEAFIDGMISEGDLPDGETLDTQSYLSPLRDRRTWEVKTATRKGGEDLESHPNDFAHGLYILHQVAPSWHEWKPHTLLLVMLQDVMRHLSRGRVIQPVRPVGAGPEMFPSMKELRERRARAAQILRNIRQTCPNTLRVLERISMKHKSVRVRAIEKRIQRDGAIHY
ncbi:hypothetical protein FOMPIDRAFT_1025561 [Fomitopsis schrenkii]|uniref:Pentacotripeptide-repeat region of PRORP domain-containing protein n=1 Tax=Fomitopsis schrenkii TaxID=2126942 RepID=S8FBS5_FOMSC|nr:hypothetical protein FOMPIDRAFT_1025561 [Fomitopsis schrenkii]